MPPLNHENVDRKYDQELETTIRESEWYVGSRMEALMSTVRFAEREKLSGWKAAFQYRKSVESPAVYYTTDEVNGKYKIKSWLEDSGGLNNVTALYTQVVEDYEMSSGTRELTASDKIVRLQISGNILDGYNLSTDDLNPQLTSRESYLEWLTAAAETVELITDSYFGSNAEATESIS